MPNELDIYSGELIYKGINFSFIFDGEQLRLIPPKDRKQEIEMWFIRPIGKGTYIDGDPLHIEDKYLVGTCNENYRKMLFFPKHKRIGRINLVLIIDIDAFVLYKFERETIDRIGFISPEIDYIYPTDQAIDSVEWMEDGIMSIKTKSFHNTTSNKQEFLVNNVKVNVFFDISRVNSMKIGKAPLELRSIMFFEFEETNDYVFIYRLWQIARSFIQFLCYRKNVNLSSVEISAPYKDGLHENFATMYIVDKCIDNEPKILEKRQYIKYEYIDGYEGRILNDIANNSIYLRHLPDTYKSGKNINAARFVMITAAFEWTFKKNYPNGIKKKTKTVKAEQDAKEAINNLIDNSTGKLKDIYKYLSGLIEVDYLQSKIIQVGKDYAEITNIFGERLYSLNKEKFEYSAIGQRLSRQRNNFAHGNLDEDFENSSLLDLMYLEYIIYAMQLKEYEVPNDKIKKAINDLFGCCVSL